MALKLMPLDLPRLAFVVPSGPLAGCTLHVRRPTVEDAISYTIAWRSTDRVLARAALVEDWSGANGESSPFLDENDNPLPFSRDNVLRCVRQSPDFGDAVFAATTEAAELVSEQAEKNSGRPSAKSAADGQETTTTPTNQSPHGSDSADLPPPPNPSA